MSLSSRVSRQQGSGGGALMLAVGVLMGVLATTLVNSDPKVTVDSSAVGAGAVAADGASASGGQADGVGAATPADAAGTTTTVATGAASAAAPAAAAPTHASPAASGGTTHAAAAAVTSANNGGATARGVTATDIKLGVAYLDLAALNNIPQFRVPPADKVFGSIYAGWKKRGEIPINGRDVKLQITQYNVLNAEDQRSACQKLVRDDKVFAVVGHSVFVAGAECVAKDEKTPIVIADPVPDSMFSAGAPFLFSTSMSSSRLGRNLPYFLKAKDLLGKKIGMYYIDDHAQVTDLANNVKASLSKLGANLVAEQKTSQTPGATQAAGPDDTLAVQRFRSAGVELAILIRTQGNFMQAAQAQGYKPTYVSTDDSVGTSNTAVSTYPADQFDGTLAMTGMRREEQTTGKLSPRAQQCLDDYVAFTGDHLDVDKRESEWGGLSIACDVAYVALEGLKNAGPKLTAASFVQGVEAVRNHELAMQGSVTFGPGKHAGGEGYRTLQWHKDCTCYRVLQPFAFSPLFAP